MLLPTSNAGTANLLARTTPVSDFRHTEAVPEVEPDASRTAAPDDEVDEVAPGTDADDSESRGDSATGARWWAGVAGLVACVAGAVIVWFPTLRVGFAGDDLEGIVRATASDGLSGGSGLYRPVALASLRVDRALWDLNARGYHATALLLTGLTAWLVGLLVFRLWSAATVRPADRAADRTTGAGTAASEQTGSGAPVAPLLPAAVAAGLFILWPAHAEAVAWIGGRGDLIATACGVAALLTWWRARDERAAAGGGSWPRAAIAWTAMSLALFVVALGAKESAIVWPLIVSAFEAARRWGGDAASTRVSAGSTDDHDVAHDDADDDAHDGTHDALAAAVDEHRGPDRSHARNPDRLRAAAAAWPFYALGAAWWVWRAVRVSDADGYGAGDLLTGAPAGPVRRWASVVVRAFVPPLPSIGWTFAAAAALVAAAGLVVWWVRRWSSNGPGGARRRWPVAFLIAALLISAVPGAVLGVSASGSLGERLALLPSVFAVALTAWGVAALWSLRRGAGIALLGAAVVACAVALVPAQARWITAGERASSLIESLAALPADQPAIVLAVPDERDGAYVGRNMLPAAVALNGWADPTAIWSALEYRADGDTRVRTELVGRSEGGGAIYRVTLTGPGARFVTTSPRDATDAVPLIVVDRRSDTEALVTVGDTPLGAPPTSIWTIDGDRVVPAARR